MLPKPLRYLEIVSIDYRTVSDATKLRASCWSAHPKARRPRSLGSSDERVTRLRMPPRAYILPVINRRGSGAACKDEPAEPRRLGARPSLARSAPAARSAAVAHEAHRLERPA